MLRSCAAGVVLAITLAGCAQPVGSASAPTPANVGATPRHPTTSGPTPPIASASPKRPPPRRLGETDPVSLVGIWRAVGVGTQNVTIRLGVDDLSVWRGCGVAFGSWRATYDGAFVASASGMTGNCREGGDLLPPWLLEVSRFRAGKNRPVLLDADGDVVARLLSSDLPRVPKTISADLAEAPIVTHDARRALRRPEPLPNFVIPADAQQVIGRWQPVGYETQRAYLEFHSDRQWAGSDGCNGVGGRWSSGADGALVATTEVQTMIGCDNVPISTWMHDAARAGFEGDMLLLFDADGNVIGRLRRAE